MLNNIVGLLGTGVAASTTSYESIATVTVGAGGSSSISFTSIPNTYKHLQIRYLARSTSSNVKVQYNSDSSNANYAFHCLRGDGSAASALGFASGVANAMILANEGVSTSASNFGVGVIDVLDYANTNKYKTIRTLAGHDENGVGGYVALNSSLWLNTAAINAITLDGGTYAQYSKFALYGIKG